jgi:alkaline ceramidase TOD1/glycosyltransferase MUCI70-like protein
VTCAVYTAVVGDRQRGDVLCFGGDNVFQQPVMEAKRYKILSHLFFDDDVTIWIDGNVWLQSEPQALIDTLLGDADIAMFQHPYRNNVWEEFAALKEDQRFHIPYLQKQLKAQEQAYRDAGLPADTPAFECNFLIRRNKESVNRLMDAWWSQICRWQWRDQVSLPYVLWKYGDDVKIAAAAENVRDHPLFKHVSKY